MSEGKRMIETFAIKRAIFLGNKEVLFCVDIHCLKNRPNRISACGPPTCALYGMCARHF